jgi:uncharacterized membrane protein YgcG
MKNRVLLSLLALTGGVLFAGCAREPVMPAPIGNLTADLEAEFAANAPPPPLAGTPRELRALSRDQLIANASVTRASRNNPFALFGEEIQFQTGIRYDRILGNLPQYEGHAFAEPMFPNPSLPAAPELVVPEEQPYRRLSGVYFGDTVSAIIQMEDGKSYLIYPGSRVGDTEWYVESIDAEKATLVRAGNRIPKRIIVRLETPPFGGGGGGNQGGGGGGNQGGGRGGRGGLSGGGGAGGPGPGPAPMGGGGIGN